MSKLKFIATKGLSFSGKSTWAVEKAKELGNCVIITKDDIRKDMGADLVKGIRVKEGKVIARRDEMIMKALEKGQNIISADTNFAAKVDHIKNMKALVYPKYRDRYDFEVKDFTDVPFDEILERVKKTDRPEGAKYWERVVKEQKDMYIAPPVVEQDKSLMPIIISDFDGTIAHMCDRSPYSGVGSENDIPNEIVCEYLKAMHEKGYAIFILSGLEDNYYSHRENWLRANGIPYDYLFMRKQGDHRKDWIIKEELFAEHIEGKYYVHAIIDDRPQMVRFWIDKGYGRHLFAVGNPFHEF
jgi:predicted kinase